ncbi:Ubiquinone/menaquinone biosynthesis C-methyltransferase UbiE [uncultured archaeon]|nr:Ubiquinone/menaquinone biosynthesis C-methyltransferase UbiE [uncultured archaeon]
MTIPKWQYHEPQHPGADFDAMAESYDQHMQSYRDIQGEIQEILDFLDLKGDQAVLEIGTGTGEFALAAACHCSRVYAVDLSAGMLKYAEKKARSRQIDNVEFLQSGFLTYRHHGPPLDAVVSQLALHHLPDFWKLIALMRSSDMLKDGGKLCLRDVVYSFDVKEHEAFFEDYISKAAENVSEEFAGLLTAHVKNEYSTLDWIMKGMLEQAGFRVDRVDHKDGFIGLYLCTKTPETKSALMNQH